MPRFTPVFFGLLLAMLAAPLSLAQDGQIIDAKPCHFFCTFWRNMSHNAQVSASSTIDNGYMAADDVPLAEDGAKLPDVSELAAVRGSVMVESPSERAKSARQKAQFERALKKPETPVNSSAVH